MNDRPDAAALFSLEGPRDDGSVWISQTAAPGWQHNVGAADQVSEVLLKWLASVDPVSTFQLTQDE